MLPQSSATSVENCFVFLKKRGVCLDGVLPRGKHYQFTTNKLSISHWV